MCIPHIVSQLRFPICLQVRGCRCRHLQCFGGRPRICKAIAPCRKGLKYKETQKRACMYLRVNSVLSVPAMALQHSHCSSAVHLCKAHKLADRSLLLRRVCWRHLVLASLYLLLFGYCCSMAVAETGCAGGEVCGSGSGSESSTGVKSEHKIQVEER